MTFSRFCYVTALYENVLYRFYSSSIYTQYPIKQDFCILLIYTHTHTYMKYIYISNIYIKHEISHLHKYSDPLLSTLLKHLWQRLQPQIFLGVMIQARHTCIWGVSPILLCRSSQSSVQQCSPSNLTELERICREDWEKLPKYRCAKLVASYPSRLEAVIADKGASTKH